MIGALVGFTAVGRHIGGAAETRFGWQHDNPYIAVIVGVGLIMLLSFFASVLGIPGGPLKVFAIILGILGFIVQYAAWTVGFGALLLTRFGTRYHWASPRARRRLRLRPRPGARSTRPRRRRASRRRFPPERTRQARVRGPEGT